MTTRTNDQQFALTNPTAAPGPANKPCKASLTVVNFILSGKSQKERQRRIGKVKDEKLRKSGASSLRRKQIVLNSAMLRWGAEFCDAALVVDSEIC